MEIFLLAIFQVSFILPDIPKIEMKIISLSVLMPYANLWDKWWLSKATWRNQNQELI